MDIVTDLLGIAGKCRDVCNESRVYPTSDIEDDNPVVQEMLRTGREIVWLPRHRLVPRIMGRHMIKEETP